MVPLAGRRAELCYLQRLGQVHTREQIELLSTVAACPATPRAAGKQPMSTAVRFGPAEHELKYEVDRFRLEAIAAHLDLLCRPDPRYPENRVVSLYFDTPDGALVHQKLDSEYLKTKVRLRWYEDVAGATNAFLEVKRRIGCQRRKARLETSWNGPLLRRTLPRPGSPPVGEELRRAGLAVAAELEPFLLVEYRRRRWVEPQSGLRLCLDTEIRPARPGRPSCGALAGGVVEIKGDSARPPAALTHLVQAGCFPTSFSKYGRCYLHLTGGVS